MTTKGSFRMAWLTVSEQTSFVKLLCCVNPTLTASCALQIYIHRVLKEVHPDLSLSNKAVGVLDGFTKDLRERITLEASQLCRVHSKATLSSREVSISLCLPHWQCQRRLASSRMMVQDAVRAGWALPVLRRAPDGSCMSAAAANVGWNA